MARKRHTQPVRVPTGGDYGSRQQLEAAQQAIPLPVSGGASGGPPHPPAGPAPSPVAPPAISRPDIFAPNPGGAAPGPEPFLPDDPAEFLRAVYMQFPSQGLRDLIERMASR